MSEPAQTTCCIVGGGPAGMVLGFLLARAGVDVTVLEKHEDFFRDFRGDTIHPSTLDVMGDIGLLDRFLELPHTRVPEMSLALGSETVPLADFTGLPTRCKFIAMMPQWDFLDFLADHGREHPGFHLEMGTEATGFTTEGVRTTGVVARSAAGERTIGAELVVCAAGRNSELTAQAALPAKEFGVPFDVLWFRLTRKAENPPSLGHITDGRLMVTLDRGDYWQCGLIVPKESFPAIQAEGIEAFRRTVAHVTPYLADVAGEITGWDQVKLLTVQIDRLETWHSPGLLCIGDSAHAMSPAGGVGVNFAVADAVAAANLLAAPLLAGTVAEADLAAVQARREPPVRKMQALQVRQGAGLMWMYRNRRTPVRLFKAIGLFGFVRRLIGRMIGLGFQPEHSRTPELGASARPRPEGP